MGFRGIYNFDADERIKDPTILSRLSVGGEIYYSILAKSPGRKYFVQVLFSFLIIKYRLLYGTRLKAHTPEHH